MLHSALLLSSLCVTRAFLIVPPTSKSPDVTDNPSTDTKQTFQSVFTDNSRFWFGDNFQTCAAPDSQRPSCINPFPGRHSLLSRIFDRSDNLDDVIPYSPAIVTYTAPKHDYYACGHVFTSDPVTPRDISPLEVTRLSQSVTSYTPEVTWFTRDPSALYTVMVWDAGYGYLHGLYVNAKDSLSSGQPVQAYHGPQNPRPTANPFVYLVVPQPSTLVPAAVSGVLQGMLLSNNFVFSPGKFLMALNFTQDAMTNMSANVMNIAGDAYGAELMKSISVNNCPVMVSQIDFLHQAMQRAGIPASWSYDTSTQPAIPPPQESSPYLTTVDTEIDILYTSPQYTFESCCTNYSYIRSNMVPDPFSSVPIYPVQVREKPRITLRPVYSGDKGSLAYKRYTLLMVDLDDLSQPLSSPPSFVIHWMVSDITQGRVDTGTDVVPYLGSNPFTANRSRMYTFLLFEQTRQTKIDKDDLKSYLAQNCVGTFPQGCFFDVSRLLQSWGLTEIRGVNWFFAERDAFAIKRVYKDFAVMDKATACKGVPGFSDPCSAS